MELIDIGKKLFNYTRGYTKLEKYRNIKVVV